MTTQENIAKHLGVKINEPFKVSEWTQKSLHVDPNMGVVTEDGDRLSNVLLQELLFGDITIIKLGKRKFNIPALNYTFTEPNVLHGEIYDACIELETIAKHMCYHDTISAFANIIAEEYRNNFKYIGKLKDFFDEYMSTKMQSCTSIADLNEDVIGFAVYQIICANTLATIAYNTLARYVSKTGLNTAMTETEIKAIINDIANNMTVDDTPQDLIDELIERTNGNGQDSKNPN